MAVERDVRSTPERILGNGGKIWQSCLRVWFETNSTISIPCNQACYAPDETGGKSFGSIRHWHPV